MLKVTEFEKMGKIIEVFTVDGGMGASIYLQCGEYKTRSLRETKTKNGWAYQIKTKFVEDVYGMHMPTKKEECYFLHDSAETVRKMARKALHEQEQKELQEKFDELTDESPITLIWNISYKSVQGFSHFKYFSDAISILKKSKLRISDLIKDNYIYKEFDWDFNESYTITFGTFKKIVAEAQKTIDKEEAEKRRYMEKREKERQEKFEEAKRTGEKVLLQKWTEPCNDPKEECSLDAITQYAMPDGTVKTVRHHTW